MNKCPCIDCICVSICSRKSFTKLIGECSLIDSYCRSRIDHNHNLILNIIAALKPGWRDMYIMYMSIFGKINKERNNYVKN